MKKMSEKEAIAFIADYLAVFFKNDPRKITHWLCTPNLNVGGVMPCSLIALGRAWKLAEFVKDAKEGNLP